MHAIMIKFIIFFLLFFSDCIPSPFLRSCRAGGVLFPSL